MNQYLDLIIERIKIYDPQKIILFGSLYRETITDDSDIDILVILDSNNIPATYQEKMLSKRSIRKSIRDINKKIPIDLIVYTKMELEYLSKEDNPFLNEINTNGRVVYEKAS